MDSWQFDLLRPPLRLAPSSQLSLRQWFELFQSAIPSTHVLMQNVHIQQKNHRHGSMHVRLNFEEAEYRKRVETDECEEHDFERESGL
eukprot:6177528-Amphidinium_carterae.1